MKKAVVLVVLTAVMLFAGTSMAATLNQKNTGCGLGSMLFAEQNGLASQTFAVTTNGTFGNGTFGITSGTSNCDKPASFSSNQKLQEFVADNMDNLARDIARGNGCRPDRPAHRHSKDQIKQRRVGHNISFPAPAITRCRARRRARFRRER